MKKVLCTIALMLLVAGSAYAQATFSMTGSYWAEGKYWFNYNSGPGTDATYSERSFGFYEQDINLYPKISVGDTSLNFKIAITDTYWGAHDGDGSEAITQINDDPTADDDNIQIERAFITHKFSDKLTLDVGLMDGTQWGTVFGDDKQPQWRVKFVGQTPVGVLGLVIEKNRDWGATSFGADTLEGEDYDSYGLFMITKVGSIYIKPLLWYADRDDIYNGKTVDLSAYNPALPAAYDLGAALGGSNSKLTLFNPQLAFNGDLGGLSFEAEINYKMYNLEVAGATVLGPLDFDEDFETLGLYLNVWKALDAMTPGFVVAYGSYDDGLAEDIAAAGNPGAFLANFQGSAAFDFEDDFNSTVILGDEYCWGGNGDDLQGMTLLKLYVNDIKTGIDPLTLYTYAAYVMSNQKDNAYEDATAWELSLGAAYKITDNLTYSVYGAYADINYDVTGIDDPDSVYVIANAIEFNF
ncbi:MAG: hypothetical protein QM299_05125 [Pseudomonadota bacterium]|nr:hypothetical protein [Pseudomonadota bacterium]